MMLEFKTEFRQNVTLLNEACQFGLFYISIQCVFSEKAVFLKTLLLNVQFSNGPLQK